MARPRWVRTTHSCHDLPIAPNLLERNFTATAPNRIWLTDITYIKTDQGWLYLADVMDLYSRRIVGWAIDDHLRTELPLAALRMAICANIQLNDRVSLRREDEILSSPQSRWIGRGFPAVPRDQGVAAF
jgi:hypothetical protein